MPAAEIIAIGTELLLGEIQDTNTRFLARSLREVGIDLYRTTIIGDNVSRIADALREACQRADVIITTGGLGPTVDDPTRQAVADCLNVPLEFRPELWQQIQDRFKRFNRQATENNRRQAWVPQGAEAIENPVGTAPAFYAENGPALIVCLPGVPREMEYLLANSVLPLLRARLPESGTIQAAVLHTAGVGESQVDEWVADLETESNPTVGLLAHPGIVDIRVTAKAHNVDQALAMVQPILATLHKRLGEHIYGQDDQTLDSVVQTLLAARQWYALAIECGLKGELYRRINSLPNISTLTDLSSQPCGLPELRHLLETERYQRGAQVALGAVLLPEGPRHVLTLCLMTPTLTVDQQRAYGGSPENAPQWASNMALDFLRRHLLQKHK